MIWKANHCWHIDQVIVILRTLFFVFDAFKTYFIRFKGHFVLLFIMEALPTFVMLINSWLILLWYHHHLTCHHLQTWKISKNSKWFQHFFDIFNPTGTQLQIAKWWIDPFLKNVCLLFLSYPATEILYTSKWLYILWWHFYDTQLASLKWHPNSIGGLSF